MSSETLCRFTHALACHATFRTVFLCVSRRERCFPTTARCHRFAFSFALLSIRADQNDFRANQKEREWGVLSN